ncbi:hypothetical protein L150_04199, partial [Candida albicans Ca529L]
MKVYNLFLIANLANGLTINPASAQPSSDVSSQADGAADAGAAGGDGMKTKHSFSKGISIRKDLAQDSQKESPSLEDLSQFSFDAASLKNAMGGGEDGGPKVELAARGFGEIFWQLLTLGKELTMEKVAILKDILSLLDKLKQFKKDGYKALVPEWDGIYQPVTPAPGPAPKGDVVNVENWSFNPDQQQQVESLSKNDDDDNQDLNKREANEEAEDDEEVTAAIDLGKWKSKLGGMKGGMNKGGGKGGMGKGGMNKGGNGGKGKGGGKVKPKPKPTPEPKPSFEEE